MAKNPVQKFVNETLGGVRGVWLKSQAWLYAADVCKVLDVGRIEKALARLDADEKRVLETPNRNFQRRGNILINESGFYHLYFSRRTSPPNIKEFKKWIAYTVLPAIRRAAAAEIQRCVYILLMSNLTVKIGMTRDFARRLRQIENGSGLTVVKSFHTEYMDGSLARRLEKCCQEHFAEKRLSGEFFNVSFEDAQAELSRLTA